MQALFMAIFAALAVVIDQVTKYLTVTHIPLHGHVDVIPGLVGLTYHQNDGAAWSILQGQQWLFVLIFMVFTGLIVLEYKKNFMGFTKFEKWCVAAIYAGGLGNMIDRLRLGYVVDMIQTEFMDFPVFNVADCFITCGCIALFIHLLFFHRDFWRSKKKSV